MSNFVFNIAKGRVVEMAGSGDDLRLLLLKTGDTEANLQDMDDIAEILAAIPVEADFTSYARKTLVGEALIIDDADNEGQADFTDVVFSPAGNGTNNNVVAAIVLKFVTNDSDSIPLTYHDTVFTTNGSDVTIQIPTDGFFAAS